MSFLALALASLALAGTGEPAERLPDLDQAVPSRISLERERGRWLLAFASATDNVGAGPLVVRGRHTGPGTMRATQVVKLANGSSRRYPLDSVLRYVRSPTHAHWHLLGFARYELRRPNGARVRPDRKTGFCLGDRYRLASPPPGAPALPVFRTECGRDLPRLRSLREGISVGYGDDYPPAVEGQAIDVTGLRAGRYLLVHRANPRRDLRESSYRNNAASVLLRLGWRGGRPQVRVLARCADSPRCGVRIASRGNARGWR